MKKLITLSFCCFLIGAQAQFFNRSLPIVVPYDQPVVTHHNSTLVYANAKVVQEFNTIGKVVRSTPVPDSLPHADVFHTGLFHHPNGNLMLYGYYHEGCDVIIDRGFYIYELDNAFSWGRTKVQSMTISGVVDMIALDNNRLFVLGGGEYAVLNGTSLDTLSTGTFVSTGEVRKALYLGGDEVLIEARTWASAQPIQIQLNVATNGVTFSGLNSGYHFDVSDTLIGVFSPAGAKVRLYNRFTQNAVDSVDLNLPISVGFVEVIATRNHLVLKSNQNLHGYKFPNMDSVGTYEAYEAPAMFVNRPGQMSTAASGAVTLLGEVTSHVPMESGFFAVPHAQPFGPLSMDVRNRGARVTLIDTNGYHSTGMRNVFVEADWEIMLYNNSNEVLDSFRLMHNLPPNYFCGPQYGLTADSVHTLAPRDSMKLFVYEVPNGPIRISGSLVTSSIQVHAVMGNGRQVNAAPATGAVVIPNVSEAEYAEIPFELYPNPAHERVRIESPEAWQRISLLNLAGKEVRRYAPVEDAGNGLSLSGLSPGVYFVQVVFEKGQVVKKLIIQ